MFNHILVPTDLTDRSLRALDIAVRMAEHDGSRVTLFHVIEVITDTDCEEFAEFYKKLGRRAEKKMERTIGLYPETTVKIEKEIAYGNRVGGIVKFVEDGSVDLVVLTSHKVEVQDASQGWGTISYKVGILSPCPVLLVK